MLRVWLSYFTTREKEREANRQRSITGMAMCALQTGEQGSLRHVGRARRQESVTLSMNMNVLEATEARIFCWYEVWEKLYRHTQSGDVVISGHQAPAPPHPARRG